MKTKEHKPDLITENILELQHEATGIFLDIKGRLADNVRQSGMFSDWQIDSNLIKFYNGNPTVVTKNMDAIVGYNLVRFNTYNPSTENYFEDNALKYIKLLQQKDMYQIPTIKRFGARTKCFVPSKLEFTEINSTLFSKFYKDNVCSLFTGRQEDFQAIIQTKEKDIQIKICLGAVKKDEVKRYFNFKSDKFNEAGLYIDIDCFQLKPFEIKDIKSLLENVMEITWKQIHKLLEYTGI